MNDARYNLQRDGGVAIALVTEAFHQRTGDTFDRILDEQEDLRGVVAALAGMVCGVLGALERLRPGSAAEFLAGSGLQVENLKPPPPD